MRERWGVMLALVAIPLQAENAASKNAPAIKVASPAFLAGEMIPQKHTADGEDINPSLTLDAVPDDARSLALIVDDPDAPRGVWNHWLVWNIAPKTREIRESSVPEKAVVGTNDFGKQSYGGPAPPSGTHRYFFKVYALDVVLNLSPNTKRNALDQAMQGHILAEGSLMGKYTRQK